MVDAIIKSDELSRKLASSHLSLVDLNILYRRFVVSGE